MDASNMFFYECELNADGNKILVSGLVNTPDMEANKAKYLHLAIEQDVLSQGYAEELLRKGRLLKVNRV